MPDLAPADEERVRAALPEVGLHFVFVDPAMFDGFPESDVYKRQDPVRAVFAARS